MDENKIFIRKSTVFFFFFFYVSNNYVAKNMYVHDLPQLFTNQSHLSTKMTIHPNPCTIYLQQTYWKNPPNSSQQSIPFPTTSYQVSVSSSITSYQLNLSTHSTILSCTKMLFFFHLNYIFSRSD